MTREQAVAKVAKLRSLARGTSNSHERDVAATRASALMSEHRLSEDDLEAAGDPSRTGEHPFDAFTERLRKYALKNPLSKDLLGHPLLLDVLGQAKSDLPAASKDRLLGQIGGLLGLSEIFGFTRSKTLRDVTKIYDDITKNKK